MAITTWAFPCLSVTNSDKTNITSTRLHLTLSEVSALCISTLCITTCLLQPWDELVDDSATSAVDDADESDVDGGASGGAASATGRNAAKPAGLLAGPVSAMNLGGYSSGHDPSLSR